MRLETLRPLCMSVLLLSVAGFAFAADLEITVALDRPDGIYSVGEEATFAVHAKQGGQTVTSGEFEYNLSIDGAKLLSSGTGQFGADAVAIKGALDEPGILRLTVTSTVGDKPVTAYAGAAFDAEKIQPTAVEPGDFKLFWQHNREKLDRVPMDPQLTLSPKNSSDYATVYKINLGNIMGTRVYGWLGVPNGKGPFPAILTVPAAGVYPIGADWVSWAKRGFIAMGITAHNVDIDLPAERYEELKQGELRNYPHKGKKSKRSYYFLTTFAACMRSIDYLTSRADWNGKTMIVTGSSQGGGLSIISAGLDPRVTAIAANVPALCDHTGRLFGRPSGWPQLIPADDVDDLVRTTSGYYDAVNFARYVHCPTLMSVGLVDRTCPATSVYSAFNVIPGPKEMMVFPLMGHSVDPSYTKYREQWILNQAFGGRTGADEIDLR